MYKKSCGCGHGGHGGCCKGRQHPTKEEKEKYLLHKKECLEKELQGINEALEDLK